ncbi:serine/threonine-protein kinase max-2 [Uranotaenia lowii]|uniref:serine/threonine-protein kinase max-2 n=1 Tax=Uranotaenia lowii TaxID=190385 RepID=UPI002478980B|nr:serine/threonine-protein kinase max-2 [Uranotaenia lowii]
MEATAVALSPVDSSMEPKRLPEADRIGLGINLDRTFLSNNINNNNNNNNNPSMKCLQYITPPDPPPAPALLFDYVVEQSVQSRTQQQQQQQQQENNLLDSEIKKIENISFTSNIDEQSENSQKKDDQDEQLESINLPSNLSTRPVVRTELIDEQKQEDDTMSTAGTETVKQSVNFSVTETSTNQLTSDQNTTNSSPSTSAIVTTISSCPQSDNPLITINVNSQRSFANNPHNQTQYHPTTTEPPPLVTTNPSAQLPSNGTASVTNQCDMINPTRNAPPPPLPSVTKIAIESQTNTANVTSEACASSSNTFYSSATASASAPNVVTTCSSKPPIPSNSNHSHHSHQHHSPQYHPQQPYHVHYHPVQGGFPIPAGLSSTQSPTSNHSVRFMTQHIKILPKTQSLDLVESDDLLEATNRTESQLDINTAGVTAFKSRVLPKLQPLDQTRPIYPNVPYSPYNSPYGSPRSGRRRTPLRESRRVSIEQSGSFLQLNQYKLLDQIGQGSYGLVKLAYSEEDSTHYAMKILSKRKLLRKAGLMRRGPKRGTSPLDRVYREIAVLKKLDHPNVVKLVEVLDDPLEDSLYLVFELVEHGEILSIPTDTPMSEERAWTIFRDVLMGVEYLHYQRIIHGDLKPANLLLSDSGSVKVADLGVCNEFLGEDAAMNNGSTAGTPAFRAPETLHPGQHFYNGKAADIWALGATLYSVVHGNVPFIATSVPGLYEKIKNDPLEFPPTSNISPELRDLIETMLDKDPQLRITLPQIKEHLWVTKFGRYPLSSEEENCRLIQINDEDMNTVVKSIPKLDTLILIKTMLKKHSFQNPFSRGISGRAPQLGGSRIERFSRSGRSNSAPGDYHTSERQPSNESLLPSVTEGASSPNDSPEESVKPSNVPTITRTPSQEPSTLSEEAERTEPTPVVAAADSSESPKPNSTLASPNTEPAPVPEIANSNDPTNSPKRTYLEVLL